MTSWSARSALRCTARTAPCTTVTFRRQWSVLHLAGRSTEWQYLQIRIGACVVAITHALLLACTDHYRNVWVLGLLHALKIFAVLGTVSKFARNCVKTYYDIVGHSVPIPNSIMTSIVASVAVLNLFVAIAVATRLGNCSTWMIVSSASQIGFILCFKVFATGSLIMVHMQIRQHLRQIESTKSFYRVKKLKRALVKIRIITLVAWLVALQRIIDRAPLFQGDTPAPILRPYLLCSLSDFLLDSLSSLVILLVMLWHTNVRPDAKYERRSSGSCISVQEKD